MFAFYLHFAFLVSISFYSNGYLFVICCLYHMFCPVTFPIPKCYKRIGVFRHLNITLETSATPICVPICKEVSYSIPALLCVSLTKAISAFSRSTYNLYIINNIG